MSINTYQLIPREAALQILATIKGLEWAQGKARTEKATGTIKRNLELKASDTDDGQIAKDLLLGLQLEICNNKRIVGDFFTCRTLCPKFNRYTIDSPEYQRHGDSATMGDSLRTDLSCTIFLTPVEDYDGGVLCVEDSFGGHMEVRGEPGVCVIYDGGQPHWVTPVTRGERICAVTWIQSWIREGEKRTILTAFNRVLKKMESKQGDWDEEYTSLGIISGKLMRMWME